MKNKKLILCLAVIAVLFFNISCSDNGGSVIDGKWKQTNGAGVLIFNKPNAECLLGNIRIWTGTYKKISRYEYDIITGFVGTYTAPMNASIDNDKKTLTLRADKRIIAVYEKLSE